MRVSGFAVLFVVAASLLGCTKPSNLTQGQLSPTAQPVSQSPLAWYSPDSSFTKCIESGGPAGRLEALSALDRARTVDFKDVYGRLIKVEVIVAVGNGRESVNTYYRNMSVCESEKINKNENLANKYR